MDPYAMYKPIRRIGQACVSCRRKKARCSGQRPQCSNCNRLCIDCIYEDHGPSTAEAPQPSASKSDIDTVLHVVSELQEQLRGLQNAVRLIANRQEQLQDTLTSFMTKEYLRAEQNSAQYISPTETRSNVQGDPSPAPSHLTDDQVGKSSSLPYAVIQRIVDTYFSYCHNQPYSFFHEPTFRRKLSEGQIPHHLLCALIATAIRFSDDPFWGVDRNEAAAKFSNIAWTCIVSTEFSAHEVANLHTVQSITMLAIFDYTAGRSRHGSAWVKIGVAIRIAQDFKLMLPPPSDLPSELQEERRRVFWSIFLLDRLASCGRDLPCSILESSCRIQLPVSESAWRDGLNETNITLDDFMSRQTTSTSTPQPPPASVVIVAHMLSKSSQYMLQQPDSSHSLPPWDPRSDLAVIESDLIHLGTSLQLSQPLAEIIASHTSLDGRIDQPSVGPAIFSRALFHLCYCILYHPFLHRKRATKCQLAYPSSLLARSLDTAFTHARSLTLLLKEARAARCLVHASFYGYCSMIAGYIASLYTGADDAPTQAEARSLLYANIAHLEDLGQMWKNASSLASALRSLSDVAYRFRALVAEQDGIALSAEDEEMLWSFVDYNTMSNGVPERRSADDDGGGGGGGGMGAVYWPDVNEQWCDLFAPQSRMSPAPGVGLF